MIEFSGEFSEESKKYLLKKNAFIGFISSLIPSVILSFIIVIISAFSDFWILCLTLLVLVLFVLIATLSPYLQKNRVLDLIIPKRIVIEEDGNILLDLKRTSIIKPLSKVKMVIDKGESYYIKFYFPKLDGFLCQKNLITKGTVEDFKKIFESKMYYSK